MKQLVWTQEHVDAIQSARFIMAAAIVTLTDPDEKIRNPIKIKAQIQALNEIASFVTSKVYSIQNIERQ